MIHCHIKREDQVYVLSGRDRGKSGRVLKVLRREGIAIVENVNVIKRHTRPNPQKNIKGGLVEKESPIKISSIMVICRECGARTRVKYQKLRDGRKVRICKKCDGSIDKT